MTTKLYLHAANTTVAGSLPINQHAGTAPTTQGGITPWVYPTGADATTVNRSMSTTKGTSQTSIAITSLATVASETYYFGKWVSRPLNQTSIAANTWSYSAATAESNLNANFAASSHYLYVWRPTTGAFVGWISQSAGEAGYAEPTAINTEKLQTTTGTGSAVTCQVGDVIIFEAWARITQGAATAYTDTLYFDGATENAGATNTTVSDIASYISTPENIAFTVPLTTIPLSETKTISDAVAAVKLTTLIARAISQTITISEAKLRKTIPFLSENVGIVEFLVKKATKPFAETIAISESKLRKYLPTIPSETIAIFEEGYGFTQYFTGYFVGGMARKAIPKMVAETVTIAAIPIRNAIRKIAAETVAISSAVTGFRGHFRNIIERISVSEGVGFTSGFTSGFMNTSGIVKFYQGFRNFIEGQCSLYFNGLNIANSGTSVQLSGTGSFTSAISISSWVKFVDHEGNYGGIISYINGDPNNRLLLSGDGVTVLFQLDLSGSGLTSCSFTMGNPGFVNNWHHFVATYDTANMKLYIDGALVGSPVVGSGNINTGATLTQIGWGSNTQYHLKGNISELALYNVALNSSEISNIYTNGSSTVNRGITNFYKFNEGSSFIIHDSAGSMTGTIINDPQWLTDLPSPIPEPSIYTGYIRETLRPRRLIGAISQTISIVDSFVRKALPSIANEVIPLHENTGGFTSGFTAGFVSVGVLKRKFTPFLATQTASIVDSFLRKTIPKIAAQTVVITGIAARVFGFNLKETVPAADGSGFTSGYTPGYDRILSIKRKFIPPLSQTTSIADAIIRRIRPLIATQSTAISEAIVKLRGHFISLTETIAISETRVRKVFPKIAAQTISIVESQLRRVIPKIIAESIALSGSVSNFRGQIIALVQTVIISESKLRKAIPKIASQTISISEGEGFTSGFTLGFTSIPGLLRRFIPTISIQSILISESRVRKSIPKIVSEIITTSELGVNRLAKRLRTLSETSTISESRKSKIIPKIAVQSTTIAEALNRLAKYFRTGTESTTISETKTRKPIPKIATQSVAISESILRKLARNIAETVSVSSVLLRKVKLSVSETKAISDSLAKIKGRFVTISETIAISEVLGRRLKRLLTDATSIVEARVRKPIPKIALQSTTITETQTRKILRPITQTISIIESLLRRLVRLIKLGTETVPISDSVSKTNAVVSIRTVVYNIVGATPSSFPGGQGFAGEGETKHRPWPVRDYIRDYEMKYRKRWKGLY